MARRDKSLRKGQNDMSAVSKTVWKIWRKAPKI
ncbi:hypothetical protein DT23_14245 [Thioclava indica]|uniref:Uncharacterized protein n=1 Tax=Thioclava indica TaxID=1353528 RepID=A0A074JUN2_9RHOB|nr:hypothetical protein DT23_14245 [Thioclava indica]